jgi:hypothetical protein
MTYFYIKPFEESNKQNTNNFNKKEKFITNDNPTNNPGYCSINKNKNIQYENNLIAPRIQRKDKTQMILKDNFHPSDYKLNYKSNLNNPSLEKTGFYYNTKNIGPGRGFGNLNISNDIRSGNSSRNDTKEYREKQEKKQMFEYSFQYLERNFQNPEHIVMPMPRGGIQTRKQNQLVVNTMRGLNSINSYQDPNVTNTIGFD